MAKDKIKVRLPKPDPRGYENMQGSPMDVKSHPAYDKPDATEHYDGTALGDTFSALGPKAAYNLETRNMATAVDISESVPRRGLND